MEFDDEERWVHRVRQSLERETAEELGAAAKVFDVPRAQRDTKPEAYTPHRFALGPYHQGRPELRDMERYKLAAAKRVEKLFTGEHKIDDLVQCYLADSLDDKIRATYHRYMELNDVTLAWMMAIDTCFLLDFLERYHRDEATDMVSSASNWINAVVRDAVMLENQIPFFLFAKTLRFCLDSGTEQEATDVLRTVFERFIKDVSPIKINADRAIGDLAKPAHFLELLYRFLVPDAAVFEENCQDAQNNYQITEEEPSLDELEKQLPDNYDNVKKACLHVSSVKVVKENLISRPMSLVSSKVPALAGVVPVIGKLMASKEVKERLKGMNLGSLAKSPLAQEIKVPSVTQLAGCGVRFAPAPEGIAGISFDRRTATMSLPVITLDGNTEAILRNLVAYEAVAVRGPLVLARYTELMNGIIDTAKDVKILKQSGVVVNQMKSNKEAAEMWNGMSRATRLSKVPRLDAVIRAVNEHRGRTAAVRARKLIKKYVFRSWKMLTLLASVVMLLMTALQTFCSAYPCESTWFGAVLQLPPKS
ncbi:hypothetical protein EJB05_54752, partial [Eragrostis curvula]